MSDSPERRGRRAVLLAVALLAALAASWWLLRPAEDPVTVEDAAAGADALGVVDRIADAAEDDGVLRVVLTEDDLAVLLREGLRDTPAALRDVGVRVLPDGPDAARLEAEGRLVSWGAAVEATAAAELADGALVMEVVDTRLAGVGLPAAARGGLDDALDGVLDLGPVLREEGVRLDGLEVVDRDVVLTGRAEDPERAAQRLREAMTQGLGGRPPPPERLGPGRLAERRVAGPATLLVVGDSLGEGTAAPDHRDAFGSRLHRALEERRGGRLGYRNVAEAGATAESTIASGQLARAVAALDGDVGLVVVSLGGNELLTLLERGPCAEDLASSACREATDAAAEAYAVGLDEVLGRLSGRGAEVVLLTPYNPFSSGLGGRAEEATDAAVATIAAAGRTVAERHGAAVADPAEAFRRRSGSLTLMTQRPPDVHPTSLGHDVLAVTVLEAVAR